MSTKKLSGTAIIIEVQTVSKMSEAKKKQYIEEIEEKQAKVEKKLEEYLSHDKEALEIVKDELRSMAVSLAVNYQLAHGENELAHYCAKKVIYAGPYMVFYQMSDIPKLNTEDIVANYKARQKASEKNKKNISLLKYMRGYAAYWKKRIEDENDCEDVTLDAEVFGEYAK